MTLPVTLAETPALPRVTEAAATGPAGAEKGEARFAETLAGVMGPAAKDNSAGKAAETVVATTAETAPDAEAMLADLEQRAVAVEGEIAPTAAGPTIEHVLGVTGTDAPADETTKVIEPTSPALDETLELPLDGVGAEDTGEEKIVEEEIPLELPLTALLAAALPAAPSGEAAAPTVQPTDASVEAARRAMAASMTMPGLAKAEKDGKGPLDGPAATDAAVEAETAKEGKEEVAQGKASLAAELRPAAVAAAPVAAEMRNAAETRREATEITLAALGGETAEISSPTAATTGGTAQVGAQPLATVAGGPIHIARPGWEAALADRIAAELSGDGQEIELDLAPETLGQLKIKLEVVDGLAQVRIVTETTEAARLFQQAEHRLSESLSRAGLSLGGQDAQSRDAQSGQAQGQAGQGGTGPGDRGGRPRGLEMHFDRQGVSALAEQAGRAGRGLVNLIA